jgi:hypothetical protein
MPLPAVCGASATSRTTPLCKDWSPRATPSPPQPGGVAPRGRGVQAGVIAGGATAAGLLLLLLAAVGVVAWRRRTAKVASSRGAAAAQPATGLQAVTRSGWGAPPAGGGLMPPPAGLLPELPASAPLRPALAHAGLGGALDSPQAQLPSPLAAAKPYRRGGLQLPPLLANPAGANPDLPHRVPDDPTTSDPVDVQAGSPAGAPASAPVPAPTSADLSPGRAAASPPPSPKLILSWGRADARPAGYR